MTVTIDLPPETEAKLREEADRAGTSLEKHLSLLATSWAGTNGVVATSESDEASREEWVKDFLDWVASHKHVTAIADDSRESIYEGRGE